MTITIWHNFWFHRWQFIRPSSYFGRWVTACIMATWVNQKAARPASANICRPEKKFTEHKKLICYYTKLNYWFRFLRHAIWIMQIIKIKSAIAVTTPIIETNISGKSMKKIYIIIITFNDAQKNIPFWHWSPVCVHGQLQLKKQS